MVIKPTEGCGHVCGLIAASLIDWKATASTTSLALQTDPSDGIIWRGDTPWRTLGTAAVSARGGVGELTGLTANSPRQSEPNTITVTGSTTKKPKRI